LVLNFAAPGLHRAAHSQNLIKVIQRTVDALNRVLQIEGVE
jgi:hypothetical protein